MVWNGSTKRVDIGSPDQVTKVIVLGTILVTVVLVYLLGCNGTPLGINVADSDNLAILLLQKSFDVAHSHAAQTNKPHGYVVAGGRSIVPAQS